MGRSQSVRLMGGQSSQYEATSGVPQGSHLRPLLFNIFINDLPANISSAKILLYADDVKIFKAISTKSDMFEIQHDLDKIVGWADPNRLALNVAKCTTTQFFKTTKSYDTTYSINGTALPNNTLVKDLGVLFDSNLSFSAHLNDLATRCARTIGFIRRATLNFKQPSSIITLYKTLVLPIICYTSVISVSDE